MTPDPASRPPPGPLVDTFGRRVTYVRVSVTDRCNLRCRYCMPGENPEWIERPSILTYEEIGRFARVAAAHGVRKFRLTGGEPLVRRDLHRLVAMLAALPGVEDVALSTNGVLLSEQAADLRAAGLRRVNISLDTLQPARFAHIARADQFQRTWDGIMAALRHGFSPVKLNMVVIRGFNDDEVCEMADLTRKHPVHLRFIEYMPIGGDETDWNRDKVVPAVEILDKLRAAHDMTPETPDGGCAGPERPWRLAGAPGRVGFISPVSNEFCASCNRLRLTSDGKLRGCLMRDGELDVRAALRGGADDDALAALLLEAVRRKPETHLINSPGFRHAESYTMNRIGG